MRHAFRWISAVSLLSSTFLLTGCNSGGSEATTAAPVLEKTTSKPPPGIVEEQQRRAKMEGEASKAKSIK